MPRPHVHPINDTNYNCQINSCRTCSTNHMGPYHTTSYQQPWGQGHTDTHTETHTDMHTHKCPYRNNKIVRNQAHTSLWLACA